tara:strand:+ start:229 stop:570 length:342 start_codon:yes stop_codon:yes gene_type:complete
MVPTVAKIGSEVAAAAAVPEEAMVATGGQAPMGRVAKAALAVRPQEQMVPGAAIPTSSPVPAAAAAERMAARMAAAGTAATAVITSMLLAPHAVAAAAVVVVGTAITRQRPQA